MSRWKEPAKTATIVVLIFLILYWAIPELWYQLVMMFAYRGEV